MAHTLQAIITPHNTVLHSLWPIIPLRSGLVMNIANRRTVHSSLSLWLRLVFLFFCFCFNRQQVHCQWLMMAVGFRWWWWWWWWCWWACDLYQPSNQQDTSCGMGNLQPKTTLVIFWEKRSADLFFLWKVRITSILPLNAKLVRSSGSCGDGDGDGVV